MLSLSAVRWNTLLWDALFRGNHLHSGREDVYAADKPFWDALEGKVFAVLPPLPVPSQHAEAQPVTQTVRVSESGFSLTAMPMLPPPPPPTPAQSMLVTPSTSASFTEKPPPPPKTIEGFYNLSAQDMQMEIDALTQTTPVFQAVLGHTSAPACSAPYVGTSPARLPPATALSTGRVPVGIVATAMPPPGRLPVGIVATAMPPKEVAADAAMGSSISQAQYALWKKRFHKALQNSSHIHEMQMLRTGLRVPLTEDPHTLYLERNRTLLLFWTKQNRFFTTQKQHIDSLLTPAQRSNPHSVFQQFAGQLARIAFNKRLLDEAQHGLQDPSYTPQAIAPNPHVEQVSKILSHLIAFYMLERNALELSFLEKHLIAIKQRTNGRAFDADASAKRDFLSPASDIFKFIKTPLSMPAHQAFAHKEQKVKNLNAYLKNVMHLALAVMTKINEGLLFENQHACLARFSFEESKKYKNSWGYYTTEGHKALTAANKAVHTLCTYVHGPRLDKYDVGYVWDALHNCTLAMLRVYYGFTAERNAAPAQYSVNWQAFMQQSLGARDAAAHQDMEVTQATAATF